MSILSILPWLNNCIHRKTLHMISKQLIVLFCAEKIFTLSEQSFSLHCFPTLKSHRGLAKNQYTTLTDNWNNWSLICFCMVAGEGQWRMSVLKCSQLNYIVEGFFFFFFFFFFPVISIWMCQRNPSEQTERLLKLCLIWTKWLQKDPGRGLLV